MVSYTCSIYVPSYNVILYWLCLIWHFYDNIHILSKREMSLAFYKWIMAPEFLFQKGVNIIIVMYTTFNCTFRTVFIILSHFSYSLIRPIENTLFIVMHVSNWLLSCLEFILPQISHICRLHFITDFGQYHFPSSFVLTFTLSAIYFPILYSFTAFHIFIYQKCLFLPFSIFLWPIP